MLKNLSQKLITYNIVAAKLSTLIQLLVSFLPDSFSDYRDGMGEELRRIEPSRMITPSCVVLLSAIELLPELLFESEEKVDFCKTPVGEDPNCWVLSHPLVTKLRDELLQLPTLFEVLVNASPKGPPIEVPQDLDIQFVSFCVGSLRSLFNPKPAWVGSNS